jgi:hypothetical protein
MRKKRKKDEEKWEKKKKKFEMKKRFKIGTRNPKDQLHVYIREKSLINI